jgi:predicted MFS family arabinose efflux permease
LGVSEALYLPAAAGLIAAYHPPPTRAKAIGIHLSGLSIGAILGGTLAGYIADRHGWRAVFRLLGLAGFGVGVASWFMIRTSPGDTDALAPGRPRFSDQLPLILARKTVLIVMFSGFAVSMAGWVLLAWLPLHLYERFHLTLTQAGFDGSFYFGISTAAGSVAGSVVSDRWRRRERGARLCLQTIGLTVYALSLALASASPSEHTLLACLGAAGLGRGLWDCNSMPVFCEVTEAGAWSTTYGLFNLVNVGGGGLAVFLAGVLRNSIGLNGMLAFFCVLLLGAAALTYVALRYTLPKESLAVC